MIPAYIVNYQPSVSDEQLIRPLALTVVLGGDVFTPFVRAAPTTRDLSQSLLRASEVITRFLSNLPAISLRPDSSLGIKGVAGHLVATSRE